MDKMSMNQPLLTKHDVIDLMATPLHPPFIATNHSEERKIISFNLIQYGFSASVL